MGVAMTSSKGITTEFQDGVAHVMDELVKNPAMAQQVIEPDPLTDAAHFIENLKDEEAALSNMNALLLDQAMNWFQIGGTLSKIKENGWLGVHASFGELCSNQFGFKKSKGYHLIAIYERLLEASVTWADVEEIGWAKLRILCAKAVTAKLEPSVFSTYVEKVKATTMTCLEVEALMKSEVIGVVEPKSTSLTFKPHADQLETIEAAIKKAKKEADTEHVTVALDHVCNVYLSPGAASQPKAKVEPKGAVPVPTPGEEGYVWPSTEQHFMHVLDKHGGDHDEAMKEVVPAFEAIFPNVHAPVEILNEDTD